MSWAGIANNQTISYNNLQDAVNNGIFTLNLAIAPTNQQCTKDYVSTHVSGFNPNYPSYAAKSSNQLVVKSDLYNPGQFTLSPQYGMYFTGLTCTGAPTFTFNVTTQTTLPYNTTIPAQTITVNLDGSSIVGYPLNLSLVLNSVTILDCVDINSGGAQTKTLTLPNAITGPSTLRISIGSGACAVVPPSVVFTNISIGATAISSTGQYQYAAGTTFLYSSAEQGYMYLSSDYGATWTQKSSVYDYFTGMAVSNDGLRVIAVGPSGSCYLSTNAGTTWPKLTSFPNITLGLGDVYSPTSINFTKVSMSGDGLTILASFNSTKYTLVSDPNQYQSIAGVYKSTDGGSSWTTLSYSTISNYNANALSSSAVYQIHSQDGGFRYSTNSGGSFANSGSGQQTLIIGEISTRNNGSEIYAVPFAMTGSQIAYPLKSTNGGATWTNITAGSSGDVNFWSCVAASDTGLIVALKNAFYGNGWYPTVISGSVFNDIISLPPTDLYQTCAVSRSAGYGLIGSTTGLYKTTNGGSTWVSI
jgi:hypothetical protein